MDGSGGVPDFSGASDARKTEAAAGVIGSGVAERRVTYGRQLRPAVAGLGR
jgi:hypothetical protein